MGSDPEHALEQLSAQIRRCRRCPLHKERTHAVPGEGDCRAAVMLVGEAPGAKEDESGRPFCGMSGRFLDDLLAGVGMQRADIFITSSVKCRPPGNRNPHVGELNTCRKLWLDPQMDLIEPDLVVLLGRTPLRQVLGETGRLEDLHGRVREQDGRRYLITYHPAAAMRFPVPGAAIWEDFAGIGRILRDEA